MDKWEIVLVIGEVLALIRLVCVPMMKLNETITKLTVMLQTLSTKYSESEKSNTQAHARIWEHMEGQDGKLQDHEIRLRLIEEKDEEER